MKTLRIKISVLVAVSVTIFQLASAQSLESDDYSFNPKSSSTASLYSQLATAVPVTLGAFSALTDDMGTSQLALISSGLIVGPSIGYFYGGCAGRGTKGIALRLCTAAGAYAVMKTITAPYDNLKEFHARRLEATAVVFMGSGLIFLEAVYDIKSVEDAVDKHNLKFLNKISTISIAPKYFADSNAGGLELNITF